MKKIIGLTGGSGAGKTTVSHLFAGLGALVIDADQTAREVVRPGQPALTEIVRTFGTELLLPDGTLDRRMLGDIVFSDPVKLNALNNITHKYITQAIFAAIDAAPDGTVAVIDAAALIESGLHQRCDYVVSVLAEPEARIRRIMARDGLSRTQAKNRINAQKKDEFYIAHSNQVLYNNKVIQPSVVKEIMGRINGAP